MFLLSKMGTEWIKILVILGLLALFGVSCNSGGTEEKLAELQGKLTGVEEELAKVQGQLTDIKSSVDTAQQTANQALALAQSSPSTDTSSEDERILLASGIALIYEHEGKQGVVNYPIDTVFVYRTYSEFITAWGNKPNIIVQLAWTAGNNDKTWQLTFADQTVVPGTPEIKLSDVALTHWHEYLVYTPAGTPTGTEPDLSPVIVDQGVQQSIVEQFAIDTSVSIELLGESDSANRPFVQLLLTDTASGQNMHTLVTILEPLFSLSSTPIPLPPDGWDSAGQSQCSSCVWGLCQLSCWYY